MSLKLIWNRRMRDWAAEKSLTENMIGKINATTIIYLISKKLSIEQEEYRYKWHY